MELAAVERSLTPSAASQTVVSILTLRVGDPRVQFGPRDAHQAAGRVQPERTIVVLDRPVNRVARQTIPARERSDAAVLQPADAALLGCGPQRRITIELKTGDSALAQTIAAVYVARI